MFDFAEKVLHPSMKCQPGNLLYVTGLKLDTSSITNSNTDVTEGEKFGQICRRLET